MRNEMKTKTRKTPSVGLKLSVSFCAKCHDSVVKSQLLRHSHTTRHNHWHGSSPQKEKPRFAKKQLSLKYKHENNVFFVFPLMMFSVAKQRVMMAGLVREPWLLGTKPCRQHEAQSAKTSAEGFLRFLFYNLLRVRTVL